MKQSIRHIAVLALLIALLACAFFVHGLADAVNITSLDAILEDIILDGDTPLSAGLDANGDGEIDIDADVQDPANGDIVTLSTPLSKVPNDFALLCQWFVDRGDGRGFSPIPGANAKTYTYTHSDAFAQHRFRVELFVPHDDGE